MKSIKNPNIKSPKKQKIKIVILLFIPLALAAGLFITATIHWQRQSIAETPDTLLAAYTAHIQSKQYAAMYEMLNEQSKQQISKEKFIERNKNIYDGINAANINRKITALEEGDNNTVTISYQESMSSSAGEIYFENQAVYTKEKKTGYALEWYDSMIFPELNSTDKVSVSTKEANRGQILDRNKKVLAGKGTASSVGLVPGKMGENTADAIAKLANLLDITAESIQTKLDAKWVKGDSLVPIVTLDKVTEQEMMSQTESNPESADNKLRQNKLTSNKELQEKLLTIPGVLISDIEMRTYPLGESASHLTGYVQNVTAEDLEEHKGGGYGVNSVIGRSGMEGLYEKELKGQDGYEISIINERGDTKSVLAMIPKKDGQDVMLTIDRDLQRSLYEKFKEDKSCSVAMNPYTGEVLALVSTPSFDSNDFLRGMSDKMWTGLNEDKRNPLYNRFRQTLCPGSSFKPIIAAAGMAAGAIDPTEDYGNEGLSWQKDSSWGDYHVTTLHAYEPVILENAMIYSDNIYFAKAALKMGPENLAKSLDALGFNQKLPFEIAMAQSQYSNSDKIETEVQLADSGYGQGQILINPLHLAALYTAFNNEGDVIKPYLRYKEEPQAEIWLPKAFSADIAGQVRNSLEKVVNTSEGTGNAAKMDEIVLAGKTGTAEIKATTEDTTGTELGWFGVFTVDPEVSRPILLISMVEDVKEIGGSTYVVKKDKEVLKEYFGVE